MTLDRLRHRHGKEILARCSAPRSHIRLWGGTGRAGRQLFALMWTMTKSERYFRASSDPLPRRYRGAWLRQPQPGALAETLAAARGGTSDPCLKPLSSTAYVHPWRRLHERPDAEVTAVALSAGGRLAALGLDPVAACAMTADGRRILVGDEGGHLTLLEVVMEGV